MTRLPALVLLLAPLAATAAPPRPEQLDALFAATDMPEVVQGMAASAHAQLRGMAHAMAGDALSPADSARLDRVVERQQAMMDEMLTWERLAPIYRRIYTETFSAEEVEAMTRFYGSPDGRSIMAKMPQAMARSMQEMQPMLREMMVQTEAALRQDFGPHQPDRRK